MSFNYESFISSDIKTLKKLMSYCWHNLLTKPARCDEVSKNYVRVRPIYPALTNNIYRIYHISEFYGGQSYNSKSASQMLIFNMACYCDHYGNDSNIIDSLHNNKLVHNISFLVFCLGMMCEHDANMIINDLVPHIVNYIVFTI